MAPQFFASTGECAAQAKIDMMEALKNEKFKFHVTASDLSSAEMGSEVNYNSLDFEALVSGQAKSFSEMQKSEGILIVPFQSQKGIVTTATLNKSEKGVQIGELFNSKYSDDLNAIMQMSTAARPEKINYISVPNINVNIVEASIDGRVVYFTDLNNSGVMNRQPIPAEKLISDLRGAAQEFNRLYGEQLKKNNKLVH